MEGRLQDGVWWNCRYMKRLLLFGALVVAAHAQPVMAQQESRELVPTASKRAINLARGTAAKSNGGLRRITQLDAYMRIQQTTHA